MTETRLCGLADGSVVLQELRDAGWVIVADGEQSASVDAEWLARNAAALAPAPRRGRKPKAAA